MDHRDDDPEHRSVDQPLHGSRRPTLKPALLTVLVLALVIGLLVLVTFIADYNATNG